MLDCEAVGAATLCEATDTSAHDKVVSISSPESLQPRPKPQAGVVADADALLTPAFPNMCPVLSLLKPSPVQGPSVHRQPENTMPAKQYRIRTKKECVFQTV